MTNKLKNIVLINDYLFNRGGADQVALISAEALAKSGYKVIYFGAYMNSENKSPKVFNLQIISTEQYDLLSNPSRIKAFIQGLWNIKAKNILESHLENLPRNETVVHIHGWKNALSSSVIRLVIKLKFPLVITLHDYFSVCPNGGFYNFKTNQICQLRALSIPCLLTNCDKRMYSHKLWRFLRAIIQQKIGLIPSRTDNFIFVSNFSKDIILPYISINKSNFRVNNPISVRKAPQ